MRIADDGTEISVPQHEVYNHHASVMFSTDYVTNVSQVYSPTNQLTKYSSSAASFVLPFWTRRTPLEMGDEPHHVLPFRPTKWALAYHLINTKKPHGALDAHVADGFNYLAQCPCSPQRDFNLANNTIDGYPFEGPCNYLLDGNAVCSIATYHGGDLCCSMDGMFVTDTSKECARHDCTDLPVERYYFKTTVDYMDVPPSTLGANSAIVDNRKVTIVHNTNPGSESEIVLAGPEPRRSDFEIEQCADGTPLHECVRSEPEPMPVNPSTTMCSNRTTSYLADGCVRVCCRCVYVHTWVEPVKAYYNDDGAMTLLDSPFQLVRVFPHVHTTALSVKLEDATTNEVLCDMSVANGGIIYGTGTEAGNEKGYIVGQKSCGWSAADAPRLESGRQLRSTFVYNASRHQTGLMAFWYLHIASPDDQAHGTARPLLSHISKPSPASEGGLDGSLTDGVLSGGLTPESIGLDPVELPKLPAPVADFTRVGRTLLTSDPEKAAQLMVRRFGAHRLPSAKSASSRLGFLTPSDGACGSIVSVELPNFHNMRIQFVYDESAPRLELSDGVLRDAGIDFSTMAGGVPTVKGIELFSPWLDNHDGCAPVPETPVGIT